MLNRDKPVGQRRGDGAFLGAPPGTHLFTKQSPLRGHLLDFDLGLPLRAQEHNSVIRKITSFGWVDRVGQPHGRTGDKLARKAANGTIGLRNRGHYAAWHLYPKAR
jgi:hypothetical protein